MENYALDCTGIKNREQLHKALAEALSFPEWYGCNLDALMDCLTDICAPTQLRLLGWRELGDWKDGFAEVFVDAGLENPNLTIVL